MTESDATLRHLAVIPARGGSKRIPGKNIRPFLGRPIIAYSIEAARRSGLFTEVMVSTDSPQVAEAARRHGAQVPFLRPAHLADDHTGTHPVVQHAIGWYDQQGLCFDGVCCIYATAPFLQHEYLIQACRALLASDKSYAFSVTSYPFPIFRSLGRTPQGGLAPLFPQHIGKRSQDLPEAYHDAGQFYFGRRQAFLDNVAVFSDAAIPIVLPRYLVQDIDTEEDWRRAELMYRAWQEQKP
jgi:pseudaminic acid cytidylyltransferase